ncbi:MAG TPA: cyclopropane-fatty-acyl-phospholipid synthase family protein, partial [Candidatus Limnocylindrales bacterium]|nr:cyclopropane-fatty-acyl-phospholipid synthase family protein [Candidatus Limnocylindrales bacterium]
MSTTSVTTRRPPVVGSLLERVAWRVGLAAAARIQVGALTVVLPDGTRRTFGDATSRERGEIHVHDRQALVQMLIDGETGGGEAYMDGLWSSPDLAALLRLAARNRAALALSAGWFRMPAQIGKTLAHRLRRNTRGGSRRNIAAHYDLGNDFYRLFLDETLTYSSAVFASPDQSLADAQRNKDRLIAEGAALRAGPHVLEIGSGWGGFALHLARERGCRVTTATISREQHALATQRVQAAGLSERIEVVYSDYRQLQGSYSRIVSIEMIEAIGHRQLGTYFATIERLLAPDGLAGIQAILVP